MIEPVTKELGAWPQFTGVEMNDLVAYVNGGPSPAIQEDGALRGSADHGWEVFEEKCIQCHFRARQRRQDRSRTGPRARTPAHLRAVRRRALESRSRHAQSMQQIYTSRPDAEAGDLHGRPPLPGQPALFRTHGLALPRRTCIYPRQLREYHGPAPEKDAATHTNLRKAAPIAFTMVSFATAPGMEPAAASEHPRGKARYSMASAGGRNVGELISFLNDPGRKK